MQVLFTRQFEKQIRQVQDKHIAKRIEDAIIDVKGAATIADINNLKKLKGFSNAYRIKVGTYRIGVYIKDNIAEFACFMNRKDIYRYFP